MTLRMSFIRKTKENSLNTKQKREREDERERVDFTRIFKQFSKDKGANFFIRDFDKSVQIATCALSKI